MFLVGAARAVPLEPAPEVLLASRLEPRDRQRSSSSASLLSATDGTAHTSRSTTLLGATTYTSPFATSTVVYSSSNGTQLRISNCTDSTFDQSPTTDVNLQPTSALEFLRSGPAAFRQCVDSRPVLALGDNGFTQAVIDYAAAGLDAGLPYTDPQVYEICHHHFSRCFMFYDADPTGDGTSPVVNGTAEYHLNITYHGRVYDYPVHMKHCGQRGYHDWVRGASQQGGTAQHCFLHDTPMSGEEFAAVLQHAEDPHVPTIARNARYAWANSLVCNKQQHVCNSIPEHMSLSGGCRQVVPKCRAALKHLNLMMLRPDPDEQQVLPVSDFRRARTTLPLGPCPTWSQRLASRLPRLLSLAPRLRFCACAVSLPLPLLAHTPSPLILARHSATTLHSRACAASFTTSRRPTSRGPSCGSST